jgi:hypothetical protein
MGYRKNQQQQAPSKKETVEPCSFAQLTFVWLLSAPPTHHRTALQRQHQDGTMAHSMDAATERRLRELPGNRVRSFM